MMIGGTMSGILVWWCLLIIALLFGFAYILWILAGKESGGNKITGQIISIAIVVLTLILFIYCLVYGGSIRHGTGMMGPGMMMQGKEHKGMMREMMKNPEMQKMMERQTEKEKK